MKELNLDGFQTIQHSQHDGIMTTIGKLPDGEYVALSCVKADFHDPEPRMILGEARFLGSDEAELLRYATGNPEELLAYTASCPSLVFEFQNEAMDREIQTAAKAVVH